MSHNEKDSHDEKDNDLDVGRTMRELRKADERLAELKEEAREKGRVLLAIGQVLHTNPAYLIEEGAPYDPKFNVGGPHCQGMEFYSPSDIQPDKLQALTEEVRSTILKIDRLTEELGRLGYKK